MEKRILFGVMLLWVTGTAYAQTLPDELKTFPVPHLQYKYKGEALAISPKPTAPPVLGEALNQTQAVGSVDFAKEGPTPIYSNMPVAKIGRALGDLPVAKADSSVKYHLLEERYKVFPIPLGKTEEEQY